MVKKRKMIPGLTLWMGGKDYRLWSINAQGRDKSILKHRSRSPNRWIRIVNN